MAVTKILARRGGLRQAIEYVLNGDKTEEQMDLFRSCGCAYGERGGMCVCRTAEAYAG